jgi:hypothetical protein
MMRLILAAKSTEGIEEPLTNEKAKKNSIFLLTFLMLSPFDIIYHVSINFSQPHS